MTKNLEKCFHVKFKVTNFFFLKSLLSSFVFLGEMFPFRVISVERLKWPILYIFLYKKIFYREHVCYHVKLDKSLLWPMPFLQHAFLLRHISHIFTCTHIKHIYE